jgi:hypothetical protein
MYRELLVVPGPGYTFEHKLFDITCWNSKSITEILALPQSSSGAIHRAY